MRFILLFQWDLSLHIVLLPDDFSIPKTLKKVSPPLFDFVSYLRIFKDWITFNLSSFVITSLFLLPNTFILCTPVNCSMFSKTLNFSPLNKFRNQVSPVQIDWKYYCSIYPQFLPLYMSLDVNWLTTEKKKNKRFPLVPGSTSLMGYYKSQYFPDPDI